MSQQQAAETIEPAGVPFEEDAPRSAMPVVSDDQVDALLLNIDGYEGPIDVLLELARNQKVDLAQISILQLVRQYLQFVERAKTMHLELAAEYLVMAAWLAYLKSRLLLPREESGEAHSADDMAEALQFQLRRLEAMQNVARRLMKLPQLGQDIFMRGAPEGLSVRHIARWDVDLVELLQAYGAIKKREKGKRYDLPKFELMSADRAMQRLEQMLGQLPRKDRATVWTTLESFLPEKMTNRLYARSTLASTLTAMLELAKQGKLEVRQDGLFRPIYLRGVDGEAEDAAQDVQEKEAV
jgi:segregation and condensation protein A